MKILDNFFIEVGTGPAIMADLYLPEAEGKYPVVIYCHGYKGFKDWGHLHLVASRFAGAGMAFLKFNFSHNGIIPGQPDDVLDEESFSKNNYSMELSDLRNVIHWILNSKRKEISGIDEKALFLLGHGRGGGICILAASRDKRIARLATWSAISDFARRFPNGEALDNWKKNGIYHAKSSRITQNLPHAYQFYEDFISNRQMLDIPEAERNLRIGHLLIHGTKDETVYLGEALHLMSLNEKASLVKIQDATHTFGGYHPYDRKELPFHAQLAVDYTITFFSS